MRRILFAAVLAATLLGLAGGVIAQTIETTAEVRIVARRLDDGRTEFALQTRDGDEWGERILPARRYFPADPGHSRWLHSSAIPITLEAPEPTTPTATTTPTPSAAVFEGEGTLGAVFYSTSRDRLSDSLATYVSVTTPYTDDYGLDQTAILLLACTSTGQRSIMLGTDEYHSTSSKATVDYRVDAQPARNNQRWDAFGSLGKNLTPSLLSASARDAVIAELRGGSMLLIRSSETPLLTFDISELFDTPGPGEHRRVRGASSRTAGSPFSACSQVCVGFPTFATIPSTSGRNVIRERTDLMEVYLVGKVEWYEPENDYRVRIEGLGVHGYGKTQEEATERATLAAEMKLAGWYARGVLMDRLEQLGVQHEQIALVTPLPQSKIKMELITA